MKKHGKTKIITEMIVAENNQSKILPFYHTQSDLARALRDQHGGTVQGWRERVNRERPEKIKLTMSGIHPEGEELIILHDVQVIRTPEKWME